MALAQPFVYQARHQHLHGGVMGTLKISADAIAFTEPSKSGKHSRQWAYADIQQLSLSDRELRILTYDDQKWQLGRDRVYAFDRLPQEAPMQLYPFFARVLDQRFVAELADPGVSPLWKLPVKLRHGLSGSQGVLLIGDDRIVYESKTARESRTWRLEDIDNIATAGPFDLAIVTLQRSDWRHAGPTEFRFQLKQPLTDQRYNELWQRLHRFRSEHSQPDYRQPSQ